MSKTTFCIFTIRDPWWASCISQTPDNAVSFICSCYEPGIICELSKLLLNLYLSRHAGLNNPSLPHGRHRLPLIEP